jgi:hypothetical protein
MPMGSNACNSTRVLTRLSVKMQCCCFRSAASTCCSRFQVTAFVQLKLLCQGQTTFSRSHHFGSTLTPVTLFLNASTSLPYSSCFCTSCGVSMCLFLDCLNCFYMVNAGAFSPHLCFLNTAVTCSAASSQSWVLGMQVEDFYFSSAAGRARIVLGNRRWGENGYVASGRQQGRPVQRTASKVKLPVLCSHVNAPAVCH